MAISTIAISETIKPIMSTTTQIIMIDDNNTFVCEPPYVNTSQSTQNNEPLVQWSKLKQSMFC